jgi:preprotein translocase subunit SecD
MKTNLRYKFFFILAIVLLCIYGIIGLPKSKDELLANWHNNIHLGLDLSGGTYLVIQVQQQDAFNQEASTDADLLKDSATKANIPIGEVSVDDAKSLEDAKSVAIVVKGVPSAMAGNFRSLVTEKLGEWVLTSQNPTDYRLTLKPTEALALWRNTLELSKNTIDKKVNALGLTEATVQQRREESDSELLVQMPGTDDPTRVKQIIQTAGVLELYDVKAGPFASREEALAQQGGVLPVGTKLIGQASPGGVSAKGGGVYVVARTPVVRGTDIMGATPQSGRMPGTFETAFVLSQEAARRFSDYTGSHIGKFLAIVLDGKVLEAPVINAQISDQGVIEGQNSQQESKDLALNLKAGSLPARVSYEQESTVGPSLGADSIHQGFIAGIAGVLAVIAVMLFYYKKSGINATLALVLNAIILIA